MSSGRPVVAVLGLGEAGSEIAAGLCSAGAAVRGFDPRVPAGPGIVECSGDADACRGAAIVLALTCAHEAEEALTAALPGVDRAAIYADMNTASSGLKAHLAGLAAGAGIRFADVALMSPVPGSGLRTPMLASGPAAQEFAHALGRLGATVEVLHGLIDRLGGHRVFTLEELTEFSRAISAAQRRKRFAASRRSNMSGFAR